MRVYMTNGTLAFLIQLEKKHPEINFFFMRNEQTVLAYYEGTKRKVFSAGRTYNALYTYGDMNLTGFVVMDQIPIQSDSKPIFEKQLPGLKEDLIQAPGILAIRILKQGWKNHYLILSQWSKSSAYDSWEKNRQDLSIKNPAYFLNRPFTHKYYLLDQEELAEERNKNEARD